MRLKIDKNSRNKNIETINLSADASLLKQTKDKSK